MVPGLVCRPRDHARNQWRGLSLACDRWQAARPVRAQFQREMSPPLAAPTCGCSALVS